MQSKKRMQRIAFISEIDKIKYIGRRTTGLFNGNNAENDTEYLNVPIDVLKALKRVLIHDIAEIDPSDIFICDTVQNHTHTGHKLKAGRRIFDLLSKDQVDTLIAIWSAFEEGKTSKARFARATDCFQPML